MVWYMVHGMISDNYAALQYIYNIVKDIANIVKDIVVNMVEQYIVTPDSVLTILLSIVNDHELYGQQN